MVALAKVMLAQSFIHEAELRDELLCKQEPIWLYQRGPLLGALYKVAALFFSTAGLGSMFKPLPFY